jgi:triphosphatase
MRVAVRRLRAILSSFSPFLARQTRQGISEQVRWVANALGEARNLDVYASEFLSRPPPSLRDTSELLRLKKVVDERRDLAHTAVRRVLVSPRYAASVKAVRTWFNQCGWRSGSSAGELRLPVDRLAPLMLERLFRRATKYADVFDEQSDEQRHRLRIALKKLRYAAELLGAIYAAEDVAPFIRRLRRLQEELGRANDLCIARDIIADLTGHSASRTGIAFAGARIVDWHHRRVATDDAGLQRRLAGLLETARFWPRPYTPGRRDDQSAIDHPDPQAGAAGPVRLPSPDNSILQLPQGRPRERPAHREAGEGRAAPEDRRADEPGAAVG